MKKKDRAPKVFILSAEDFFRDTTASPAHIAVLNKLEEESRRIEPDECQARQDAAWNFLANKVVGSELGEYRFN